jgi:hypothetical protein
VAVIVGYGVLAAVLIAVPVSLAYCIVTGISPIPSTSTARDCMFACLPADLTGKVAELGAGWGSLAFPLAAQFPSVEVLAFEVSPVPWLFMLARYALVRPFNVTIRRRNFMRESLEGVSAVVCYLHSEALAKARAKLEAELAPGTLVISNTFDIPGWEPERVYRLDDSFCPEVYVYRVPAAVVGLPASGRKAERQVLRWPASVREPSRPASAAR